MEKKKPIIEILGTVFEVDVAKQQLSEQRAPDNTISFLQMKDEITQYTLTYSPKEKNLPGTFDSDYERITIPQMKDIDPEGMSAAYGVSLAEIGHLSDFEIVVDQTLVAERLSGKQPTIEIAGHTFFVDLHWGLLRPKDDFETLGISIKELDYWESEKPGGYTFPYNTKTHELIELDFRSITAIPKDVILVEIPDARRLDPVMYAKMNGFDIRSIAREHPPQRNQVARIIPWDQTPVREILSANQKKLSAAVQKQTESTAAQPKKKRGKRM